MPDGDFASWAQHLKHPLVLAGFAILIGAGVISALFKKDIFRLSGAASERIIKKGLTYAFALGVLVIVLALWSTIPRQSVGDGSTAAGPGTARSTQESAPAGTGDRGKQEADGGVKQEGQAGVKQESRGDQSPNIVGRDVRIDYGSK